MKKYILTSGREIDEEYLEDFYRVAISRTFNERDYKSWKYDMLEAGKLRFAE
jgi:hypothetical protein